MPRPTNDLERVLPNEIAYADDVDFVALSDINIQTVQKVLEKHNLIVNVDKTDFTTLIRNETSWKSTKKVGSLIGDKEDIERRKQLPATALYKMKNV